MFGLASTISVIILGDESGYEIGDVQKVKLAAIEAEETTRRRPASPCSACRIRTSSAPTTR